MSRILIYTSPALGHLHPVLGPALELRQRGHTVRIVTLAQECASLETQGLEAAPISAAIESCTMQDHTEKSPVAAVKKAISTFAQRAPLEMHDLQQQVQDFRPELLVIDTNCFGARTVAEASGLPWCCYQPFFTPLPGKGVPPFGPGLKPATGVAGAIRDTMLRPLVSGMLEKLTLTAVNPLRQNCGLAPAQGLRDFYTRAPKTLYFTSPSLDYPRTDWPESFVFCGPAVWERETATPDWLEHEERPVVLVTCSTEAQHDRKIIETAIAALADGDMLVVATSAAEDAASFAPSPHARVEQFIPHGPVLRRAAAVICHGGMGITQKALSHGVPVCVVPFGRDQLEVARRIEHAQVGVRLPPGKLQAATVKAAIQRTCKLRQNARTMAQALNRTGGTSFTADQIVSALSSAS